VDLIGANEKSGRRVAALWSRAEREAAYKAASPRSPVRIRTASSMALAKILPSPGFPV
jgi:hypothetical protein